MNKFKYIIISLVVFFCLKQNAQPCTSFATPGTVGSAMGNHASLPETCSVQKIYARINNNTGTTITFTTTFDFGDGSPQLVNSHTMGYGWHTPEPTHSYTLPGTYVVTLTVNGPGVCMTSTTTTVVVSDICTTCSTYSILSTGFDRVNNVPFAVGPGPASFDPYWNVVRRQDLAFGGTPIPGTIVNYSGVLAYDIWTYTGFYSIPPIGNSRYISVNPTNAAVYPVYNCITYRTFFNLPNPMPPNNSYSLAISALADDAIYQISLNGVDMKSPGYVGSGSAYWGPPLIASASSGTFAGFQPGSNYIDIVASDLGLSQFFLGAEIILYECGPPPLPCSDCISSFAPVPGKKYLVSGWTKENNPPQSKTNYTYPSISVLFPSISGSAGPFLPGGNIIDGWQRIEGEFTIPPSATDMTVKLDCTTNDCFYDDVRVLPFDGSMKSYVYDPVNMRLVAELDERNYATLYEYDEEGKLIRVKKETEKGKMTIQENRNNTKK